MNYNSRTFSRLGQSGAIFGLAAPELNQGNFKIKILSADMAGPAGLERFKNLYPNDFYNVGIAEQNLIGVAAGLCSEGYKTIATAQAAFISMRSFEQLRQFAGYMKFPIIIIGINAGFALTYFGNTHYAVEDIGILRTIPNLTILSPADAGEAVKCFQSSLHENTPVYIRLTGTIPSPIIYKEDFEYKIGEPNLICEYGTDVTVFATGNMVFQALEAAKVLNNEGIFCRIVNVHTLKPFSSEYILKYSDSDCFVTIEEHNVIGGLGEIISGAIIDRHLNKKLIRIGVDDKFSVPGDYEFLLETNGLSIPLIAKKIKNNL